jgi:hypothetical protein
VTSEFCIKMFEIMSSPSSSSSSSFVQQPNESHDRFIFEVPTSYNLPYTQTVELLLAGDRPDTQRFQQTDINSPGRIRIGNSNHRSAVESGLRQLGH